MSRASTIRNLYDKRFSTFPFTGIWEKAIGQPETHGVWLVYGPEKNGKTWFSLKLAEYISTFVKMHYISAEEGTGKGFVDACRRAQICVTSKNLMFLEYITIEELDQKLSKRKAPGAVVLDNLTIYADELRAAAFRELIKKHGDTLFILVAHEEKGQPYTAPAKLARKLAKVIIQVKGLTAHVSGRCPGGSISIDETQAQLYWGTSQESNN